MVRRIVILGAPGAGKGTQARKLAKRYSLPHISTGDIFRAHVEEGTDLGKQIESYMESGKLLPDQLACQVVAQRVAEPDCKDGYILDGFPRSMPQAVQLDTLLAARGQFLTVAINLTVDDDEIVERLSARRTCPQCGKIYNLKFGPEPSPSGECVKAECDGVKVVQRSDDQEETVRQRLRVYHETTEPIIAFYREKGLLRSVGGPRMSPDEVAEKIEEYMRSMAQPDA